VNTLAKRLAKRGRESFPPLPRLARERKNSADKKTPDPFSRGGFSLLEVLMAMGVLLGCIIVLTELAAIGRAHANDAQTRAKAQLLCQARLNEMLAGVQPVMPVQKRAIDEEPEWTYSVEIDSSPHPGLSVIRVVVAQDLPEEQRPQSFSLIRWIGDPHGRIAAAAGESLDEQIEEEPTEEDDGEE